MPTYDELNALLGGNYWPSLTTVGVQNGAYFNGTSSPGNTGVFLPAAGRRDYITGDAENRGSEGRYWTSLFEYEYEDEYEYAYYIEFSSGMASTSYNIPAFGYSVRCVQE